MPAEGTVCEMRGLVGVGFPESPVVIDRITPGSPSEAAGVLVGDLILKVDGKDIEVDTDFPDGPPGSEIVVLLKRGDEEVELTITRGFPVWELWRSAE